MAEIFPYNETCSACVINSPKISELYRRATEVEDINKRLEDLEEKARLVGCYMDTCNGQLGELVERVRTIEKWKPHFGHLTKIESLLEERIIEVNQKIIQTEKDIMMFLENEQRARNVPPPIELDTPAERRCINCDAIYRCTGIPGVRYICHCGQDQEHTPENAIIPNLYRNMADEVSNKLACEKESEPMNHACDAYRYANPVRDNSHVAVQKRIANNPAFVLGKAMALIERLYIESTANPNIKQRYSHEIELIKQDIEDCLFGNQE
jgi:hypothetical protein